MSPASVEVGPAPEQGHGRIRRSHVSPDELITEPYPGVETVTDVLHYTVRTHGNKPAWGYRDIVKVHEEEKMVKKNVGGRTIEEKKVWKFFELSDYKFQSYVEFSEYVKDVSAALISLGLPTSSIFNVYASTCLNWQVMQHAVLMAGSTIATAYDTLGEAGLTHSLNEPSCVGIFTHADLLPVVSRVIANTPSVKFVIFDGEAKQQILEKIRGTRDDVQVLHIDDLRAKGKVARSTVNFDERAPKPEDTACIMYTSGTTGAPKGVVLTHGNLVAAVGAVIAALEHLVGTGDHYIAYLPLAHILEYIVELTFFCFGITIGFGNIKTLTDNSVRNCPGDLRALKPTIMVGVPAVWETIRKGITSKVEKMPQFKKNIFNGTMALKKMVPALGGVLDATVLNAVKTATGGRLRFALSGGAAISRETQEFLNIALVNLLQGYGLTESCGMCAILTPEYFNYGVVGAPSPAIEVKLVDAPEAGYLSSNDPPRGEVWIRGPAVTKGYFKRDDLNSDESIFPGDGWFRTGDIGQWNPDGTLSLIDRIKNLVKLSGGEYIALERLESTYKACSLVSNLCVHAHSDARQPMAIIIPHKDHLLQAIASSSDADLSALADKELHALVHEKKVAELVLKELNALGKKNGFKPMELLESVVLTDKEWTPENGLVTAAQKIQRKKIAQEYADEIKAVYPY